MARVEEQQVDMLMQPLVVNFFVRRFLQDVVEACIVAFAYKYHKAINFVRIMIGRLP